MKTFKLTKEHIKPVATGYGGCIATDRILVDGAKVGVMRRDEPINQVDSGWQFMAGDEDENYMDENSNHGIYDVNTIANYDPDIIPFLDAPTGSAFERDDDGVFVEINDE